ncbi:MAG TPA: hypothetical protein VGD05_14065 [Pyrinomonadaceae bacterium]|jgi:hypothetical protein
MAEPKRFTKVIKKRDLSKAEQPKDPLYLAFTYQLSAALAIARQIPTPPDVVRRFLDEFERKAV